jgi:neural Wiskott-Aldrich syndrome protein
VVTCGFCEQAFTVAQNHLPNKRHIGKQDPYCVVSVNGDKRRTKAIKRGGQHPEWDEEMRFEIREALEPLTDDGTPPPPPPKGARSLKDVNIEGGKVMKIACYADDAREPELIGETEVDLTQVLTKGECDGKSFSGRFVPNILFQTGSP